MKFAFSWENVGQHLLTSHPEGVEECALGRQLHQPGHPVEAQFCEEQKQTEVTWWAESQPCQWSPEMLEILEPGTPTGQGVRGTINHDQGSPTWGTGLIFHFLAHYGLELQLKIRKPLAPHLPVFSKSKSSNPVTPS